MVASPVVVTSAALQSATSNASVSKGIAQPVSVVENRLRIGIKVNLPRFHQTH
jgi:hypothetical protein